MESFLQQYQNNTFEEAILSGENSPLSSASKPPEVKSETFEDGIQTGEGLSSLSPRSKPVEVKAPKDKKHKKDKKDKTKIKAKKEAKDKKEAKSEESDSWPSTLPRPPPLPPSLKAEPEAASTVPGKTPPKQGSSRQLSMHFFGYKRKAGGWKHNPKRARGRGRS